MNWRRFALTMTGACGGLLMAQGAYVGGFLLLAFALAVAVGTEIKL